MRALAVALLVHAAVLLSLPTVTPRTPLPAPAPPLDVELVAPSPLPAIVASAQPATSTRSPRSHRIAAASAVEPRSMPSEAAPTPPVERTPSSPAAPADLFPRATLDAIAGPPPRVNWGGTTRNGSSPPAPTEDAGAAAKRALGEFTRGVQGELDARQGRVDPVWRDLERGIERVFHPSASEITDENRVTSLARQYLRALRTPAAGGPTPRGVDPSRAAELGSFVSDQIAASQRALAEPGEWRRIEITVTVDAEGRVREIAFSRRSDRGELDRAAIAAVRRAAADRILLRDPRGAVRVRYAVEAAVAVTPISSSPIVDPVSGAVQGATVPLFGLSFDADFKHVGIEHPLKRQVKTRVALLSVEPAD